jgi:hypothetical protein
MLHAIGSQGVVMQHYRDALADLNSALDHMIAEGDTLAMANIAHPIRIVEQAILQRQADIIAERYGDAPPRI